MPSHRASPGREQSAVAQTAAGLVGSPRGADAVPAGRVVQHQGHPCSGPFVVVRGALLETSVDDEGRVMGLDVLGAGDAGGGPCGLLSPASIRAVAPSRIRPVPPAEAEPLEHRRHERMVALARDLAWLDVTERIAGRLDDLAQRFGRPQAEGTLIRLAITQEDLAALCGTSRESANRALGALSARGRIRVLGRGRYLVPAPLRVLDHRH